jgi:integrase
VKYSPEPRPQRDGTVSYRVRYRINGRRVPRTFTGPHAEAGAVQFCRLLEQLGPAAAERVLEARLAVAADDAVPTVRAWCEHHVEALSGIGTGTRGDYLAYIRNDLGVLAELPLDAVTDVDIAGWVNAQDRAGSSGKTIRNKHGLLYAAFDRAVKRKIIPANPCQDTRLPVSEVDEMVFLTPAEMRTFLRFVTPHWRPLVEFLFVTGLRWSEATALQVRDVDFGAGTVSVVRAWKDTDTGRRLGPPKSKKSRRTIALAPSTVELLRPLVVRRQPREWLFLNQRGDYVKHQTFHDNVWSPTVRLANGEHAQRDGAKRIARRLDEHGNVIQPATSPLGKRPRIHDARHSCASWLLGAGVPIHVVRAHLGHENIATTVDQYGHLMPGAREAVAGALDVMLAASADEVPDGADGAAA